MSHQSFETKYGCLAFDVKGIQGSVLFYTLQPMALSAGHKLRNGRVLRQKVLFRPGTILIPKRREDYPRGILWQIFPYGLYEAFRSCLYIRDGYEADENGECTFLDQAGQEFYELILLLAQYRHLTSQQFAKIKSTLDQWFEAFKSKTNQFKQEATDQLEGALDLVDSRGRTNPGMASARLTAARNRLTLRFSEIKRIDPRIGARQIALLLEKHRIERTLCDVWHDLHQIYNQTKNVRYGNWAQRGQWHATIQKCLYLLGGIEIGPFPVHIQRMQTDLKKTDDCLSQHQVPQVRVLIHRVMESIRCKKARRILENLILEIDLVVRYRQSISPAAQQTINNKLLDFSKRLRAIDDTGFKKPVREPVEQSLIQARQVLTQGHLREVKTLCRAAARRL